MVTLQWNPQMMVTGESQADFVIKSPGDLLQSNSHGDLSVGSPNYCHLRRIKSVTFQFTIVTVTLVNMCDVKEALHRMAVLLGQYLFLCRLYNFLLNTQN